MSSWTALAAGILGVAQQVMKRAWGNETKAQARVDQEIDALEADMAAALAAGDVARANDARERLHRLHGKVGAATAPQ